MYNYFISSFKNYEHIYILYIYKYETPSYCRITHKRIKIRNAYFSKNNFLMSLI